MAFTFLFLLCLEFLQDLKPKGKGLDSLKIMPKLVSMATLGTHACGGKVGLPARSKCLLECMATLRHMLGGRVWYFLTFHMARIA